MSRSQAGMQLGTDASGVVTGIRGLDGILRKVGQPRPYTALVVGDSITAFAEATVATTSITDNGDGTATVVTPSAHGLCVGQPIRTNITANQATNVMDSTITSVISTTSFKIQLGGRTHTLTSANPPNIIIPLQRWGRGWFNWVEYSLGVSLKTTWCAVGGAASYHISALLDATPVTEAHDLGFVCIGMNDVYSFSQTQVQAQANIKTLIDKTRAKCSLLVIIGIPPRNSADTGNWTTARQAIHTKLNRWMHQYAQQIGALYFDPAASTQNGVTYVDSGATYPDPHTAFMYDYTHPSTCGAQAIGFGIASLIGPYVGVKGWKPAHRSQISTDTGNILVNADFSASTSGVANTWAVSGATTGLSLTPTVVQRTTGTDGDAVGYNQVFNVNYGTVASGFGLFYFRRNTIQSLLTAGTTIQWKVPFTVTNSVGLCALELTLNGTLSDGTTWQVYGCGLGGNSLGVPGSFSGYLITPPAVVPANLSNLDIWIRGIINNTQTTDVIIKYFQPELLVIS